MRRQPPLLKILLLPEARIEAAAAARLVSALRADEHALAAGDKALRVIGRGAAHHADGQGLGDVFGDGEELRHRLERLSEVVLIEPGHDDAFSLVRERVADGRQFRIEELALVDPYDLGVGCDVVSS